MSSRYLVLILSVVSSALCFAPATCWGDLFNERDQLELDHPVWIEANYLGWFVKGNNVPPLITTSPATTPRAQAGVLGQDTAVLFGGGKIDDDYRSGLRLHGGMWLDPRMNCGIELGYLTLFDESSQFVASTATTIGAGDGLPILARPFFNVTLGAEDSELVSFPAVVDGIVGVRTSSRLNSAEVLVRALGYSGRRSRVDFVTGYRYFQFDEDLSIAEDLQVTESGGLIAEGTRIQVFDGFSSGNNFHGAQLGMSAECWREYVSLKVRARVALGGITNKTTIQGTTVTTVPGGGTSTASGGLLALPTNIGTYRDTKFAALPEFGAEVKLQLTQRTQFTAGYTLLLLNDVARSGRAIDRLVNPSFIPGAPSVDATRLPAFRGHGSDFWVQGINLGLVITN